MLVLAYGAFKTNTFPEMFLETLPFFLRIFLIALAVYLPCSFVVGRAKYRYLGVVGYVVAWAVLLPEFSVLGAYGPAHVAVEVGVWTIPLFGVLLVVKTAVLYVGDASRGRCPPPVDDV
ncbi:MAG: hypothetical protein GC159_17585 [Phycisphaera sp.]|nr:hypothetical protein [Phycisphaera sp.]